MSTSKFPSQNRSNSPDKILKNKPLNLQYQISHNMSDIDAQNRKKGIAGEIMHGHRERDQDRDKSRDRDGNSAEQRVGAAEVQAHRMRAADKESLRKSRFIEQMNDPNPMVQRNNLGITGRGMLLSGNGFNFNMREAKYLARQNLLNMSDQSNNVGFGSTFNQGSISRNNRDPYPID